MTAIAVDCSIGNFFKVKYKSKQHNAKSKILPKCAADVLKYPK